MPRIGGDITYSLLGAGQPTLSCTRNGFIAANPQSQEHHNTCAVFDGVSSEARLVGDQDLGIGNTWSINMWVAPASLVPASKQSLFVVRGTSFTNIANSIAININSSGFFKSFEVVLRNSGKYAMKNYHMALEENTGTPGIQGIFFAPDNWTQITVVFDGDFNLFRIYRNAIDITALMTKVTDIPGVQTNTPRTLAIGSSVDLTNRFEGKIHQVTIWNEALSHAEILNMWNQGSGATFNLKMGQDGYVNQQKLQAHYKLNQLVYNPGQDFSGHGRDLSTASLSSSRSAPNGTSFETDGTREIARTALDTAWGLGEYHTLLAWVRIAALPTLGNTADIVRATPTNTTKNQVSLGVRNIAGQGYFCYEVSNAAGTITNTLVSNASLQLNTWYCVTGTKNSLYTLRLFVNGLDAVPPLGVGLDHGADPDRKLSIGYDIRGINEHLEGNVHSLAMWDTPLSEESIKAVYNGGWQGLDLRNDNHPYYAAAPNLKHWYRFGQGSFPPFTGGSLLADWAPSGAVDLPTLLNIENENILKVGNAPLGTSASFGSTDAITTVAPEPIEISTVFTISMWVKPHVVGALLDQTLLNIEYSASSQNSITVNYLGNDLHVDVQSNLLGVTAYHGHYVNVLTPAVLDTWQHLLVTFDVSAFPGASFYYNGTLFPGVLDIDNVTPIVDAFRSIFVGGSTLTGKNLNFEGLLSDIGIWDVRLGASEIEHVFNQGKALDLRFNDGDYASAEHLKHYYKFGEDPSNKGRDFIDTQKGTGNALSTDIGTVLVVGEAPTQ